MALVQLASLVGVALLVLILNVAMSVVYMVIYGYLINPGHPKEYYDQHIKVAAPYCSIVAGAPIMFFAGLWVAGWSGGGEAPLGVNAAVIVWLSYAIIDVAILLAAGRKCMTRKIIMLCVISLLTKLGAAYAGALVQIS